MEYRTAGSLDVATQGKMVLRLARRRYWPQEYPLVCVDADRSSSMCWKKYCDCTDESFFSYI